MMDRLKNSPEPNPEDGELVTRSDGSQAIRVRKRKRRSSQPHKAEKAATQRARIFQVAAAMVLLFIAALIAGGAIIYANSSHFREKLVHKIEQASGATAELTQFRMNPKTANAASVDLKWPPGNVLDKFSLRGLNAEVFPSSFLGNTMTGEEIHFTDGMLALKYPIQGEALREIPAAGDSLPIRFNRYRIPALSLTLGDPVAPIIRLSKSEASLNPATVNGRAQLSLYHGDINIIGWPKLRLDRALAEFSGRDSNLIGLRVLHETDSKGFLELSGPVYPYQADRVSSLQLILDSFEISGITGNSLGRLFSGRIDSTPVASSNFLSFQPIEDSSPELEITFHVNPSSRIEVRGFPFLLSLALHLDDSWFQEPVFESEARGTIHRQHGIVALRNLNFETKGRMALRGNIIVSATQQLSGNFEIGIAEAMILTSKNPRIKSMFGPAKEGFRWINLKISGPVATPSDNFKEIFEAAGSNSQARPAEGEGQKSTFEELTRPK